MSLWYQEKGVRIAQLIECRTLDRKVAGSIAGRSGGRIFFLRVIFLCWIFYGSVPRPFLAVACKRPKSAGGRLQLNTYAPVTNEAGLGWLCCPGMVWKPHRETSAHATPLSCVKMGLLRSRSRSQRRFKILVNVCPDDIFWTTEHIVA